MLAEACSDGERAGEYARALSDKLDAASGAFAPVIARLREEAAAPIMDALTISASAPPARIVQRLSAALRVRALHATVLRRMETLASRGETMPDLPDPTRLRRRPCWSPGAAGRIRNSPSPWASASASSARSASKAPRARSMPATSTASSSAKDLDRASSWRSSRCLPRTRAFANSPSPCWGPPRSRRSVCRRLPNLDRIAEGPDRLSRAFFRSSGCMRSGNG